MNILTEKRDMNERMIWAIARNASHRRENELERSRIRNLFLVLVFVLLLGGAGFYLINSFSSNITGHAVDENIIISNDNTDIVNIAGNDFVVGDDNAVVANDDAASDKRNAAENLNIKQEKGIAVQNGANENILLGGNNIAHEKWNAVSSSRLEKGDDAFEKTSTGFRFSDSTVVGKKERLFGLMSADVVKEENAIIDVKAVKDGNEVVSNFETSVEAYSNGVKYSAVVNNSFVADSIYYSVNFNFNVTRVLSGFEQELGSVNGLRHYRLYDFSDVLNKNKGARIEKISDYSFNVICAENVSFADCDPLIIDYITPQPTATYWTKNWWWINVSDSSYDDNQTYVAMDWNRTLVLWMRFENDTARGENGTFFNDESTYSNNATCSNGNCPSLNDTGKFGKAYTFDSMNDKINISHSRLRFTDNFTISAWVYINGVNNTWQGVVDAGINGAGYFLGLGTDNKLSIREYSGAWTNAIDSNVAPTNQWLHVAGTRTNGGNLILYLNGNQVASQASSGTITYNINQETIGGTYAGAGAYNFFFNGSIDDIQIYSRALTSAEINASMNSTQYRYINNFTSLSDGNYTYQAHSINSSGAKNSSALYTIAIDATLPAVNFTFPTPYNTSWASSAFYVNVTSSDLNNHYTILDWNRTLVLWMRFENDTARGENGTFFNDESIYSNNGTCVLTSCSSLNSSGKFGKAYDFNGINNSVYIPPTPSLNLGNSMTISMWFNRKSTTSIMALASSNKYHVAGYSGNWIFRISDGSNLAFVSYDGIDNESFKNFAFTVNNNVWNYATVSINGSNATVYLNGVASTSGTLIHTKNLIDGSVSGITIGDDVAGGNVPFNGSIDEVQIYSRALTSSEINASYTAGTYKYYNNFTNLTDGSYTYKAYSVDIAGNKNETEMRNVTIANAVDTIFPLISIIFPTNNTYQNIAGLNVNYTISDLNLQSCWYSNDTYSGNTTITCGTNLTSITWTEGQHNVTIWANDTANNVNWSRVQFIMDSVKPAVNFTFPTPYNTSWASSAFYVNVTSSDLNDHYTILDWNKTLVLWMRFENDTSRGENGTFFNDESTYSNNGTCANGNCPTLNQTGKFGKGMNGNISGGSKISINSNSNLNKTSNISWGLWYKPIGTNGGSHIILTKGGYSGGNDKNDQYNLWINDGGNIIYCSRGNGSATDSASGGIISMGNWYQLFCVLNSTGLFAYINGALVATDTSLINGTTNGQASWDVGYNGSNLYNWNGTADEVQIYSRALSSSEINASYTATSYKYYNNFTGLADATYTYKAYAVDIAGNKNETEMRNVIVDTLFPTISITSPVNNTYQNIIGLNVNYTVSDLTLQSCWYSNDTYGGNTTITCGTNLTTITWTEGQHNVTIWTNDTLNNVNWSRVQFIIDSIKPAVNFTFPTPYNTSWASSAFYVNVTSSDLNDHYTILDWNRTLVIWMRFENDTARGENGTFFNDESTYSNNGTCASNICPMVTTTGKFGNGLNFNNSQAMRADIGANIRRNLTGIPFSMEVWVKPHSLEVNDLFFGRAGLTWFATKFSAGNCDATSGRFNFGLFNLTNNWFCINSTTVPTLETWYHIVGTYNTTHMKIYINGNLEGTRYFLWNVNQAYIPNNWSFGYIEDPVTYGANATIDEAKVYLRELSSSEINASYTAGTYKYYNNFTGLADATYTYKAYAVDIAGNKNETEMRNVTIDTLFPTISITSPVNNTYQNIIGLNVNYTVSDLNLQSCWYSNDTYGGNTTITCGTNLTTITWIEGQHNVTIWANDSANNVNWSRVQFIIDSVKPAINFTFPTPYNTSWASSAFYVNVTSSDLNDHYTILDWNKTLVLWMRFENDTARGENGTFFNDESTYSNNGTCSNGNCPSLNDTGKFGKAETYNATPFINITDSNSLHPTSNVTLIAWVKTTDSTNYQTVFLDGDYDSSNYWGFSLLKDNTNKMYFYLANNSGGTQGQGWDKAVASVTVNDGNWHHIVGTFNGTTINIFQDGVLVGNKTYITPIIYKTTGQNRVIIGSWYVTNGNLYLWRGSIDDVQLYSRILTSSEINASYTAGTYKYYNNFTGLADATYTYKAYSVDLAGNMNYTETRNVTIDTIFPQINLTYPLNTTYTAIQTRMNYTVSDLNLQSCWFYNGTGNNTITCGTNATTNLYSNQGANTWIAYANDTANNVNSSSITFFVDSIAPTIDYVTPTDTTNIYLNRNFTLINVTSTDTNLMNISIRLYNSTRSIYNITNTTTSPNFVNITNLPDGTYYFNATATDTLGNKNETATRNVTIDTVKPILNFTTPTPSTGFYSPVNYAFINVTSSDLNDHYTILDWNKTLVLWMRFENDTARGENGTFFNDESSWSNNGTCSNGNCPTLNQSGKFGKSLNFDGTNDLINATITKTKATIMFWYKNSTTASYQFVANTSGTTFVDGNVSGPLEFPINISGNIIQIGLKNNSAYFNGSIDEVQIYSRALSSSEINASYTAGTYKYYNNFTGLADATYTYKAYAVDLAGNLNYTETRNVTIDTAKPVLNFTYPTFNGSYYPRNSFYVNVSSSDLNNYYTILDWNKSLRLWMRFENQSGLENGTYFKDESSYQTNGTCITGAGCPAFTQIGRFGGAADINGNNVVINISDSSNLNFNHSNNFTIEAWATSDGTQGGAAAIVVKSTSHALNDGYGLIIANAGTLLCFYTSTETDGACYDVGSAGTWFHVAGIYNGTTNIIYVDGVQRAITTETGKWAAVTAPFVIGRGSQSASASSWDGKIDEVKVHNRALTSAEINASRGASKYYNNFTGLADATYTFKAYAVDLAANMQNTSERNITIDNTKPLINFTYPTPANYSHTNVNSVTVNLTATDVNQLSTFVDWNRTLVSWYRMGDNVQDDPITNRITVDEMGYSNATGFDQPITKEDGRFGKAYLLDGWLGNYFELDNGDPLNSQNNATIEGWFRPSQATYNDEQGIFGRGQKGTNSYAMYIQADYKPSCYFAGIEINGTTTINNPNSWYHISCVYNSSNVIIYINGNQETITAASGTLLSSTGTMFIGAYYYGNANGTIDNVRVWKRALSGIEINSSFYSQRYNYTNTFTSLADGNYTFRGYSEDLAGNTNSTEHRTVTVDTILPAVQVLSPLNNPMYYLTDYVLLKVNATDLNINTTAVKANVTIPGYITEQVSLAAQGGGIYSLNYQSPYYYEGLYNLTFQVSDLSGNTQNNLTNFTKYNTQPENPLTTEVIPASISLGNNGTYFARLVYRDDVPQYSQNYSNLTARFYSVSSLANALIIVNTTNMTAIDSSSWLYNFNSSVLGAGTYIIITAVNTSTNPTQNWKSTKGFVVINDIYAWQYRLAATGTLYLVNQNITIDALFTDNNGAPQTGASCNVSMIDENLAVILNEQAMTERTIAGISHYIYQNTNFTAIKNVSDYGKFVGHVKCSKSGKTLYAIVDFQIMRFDVDIIAQINNTRDYLEDMLNRQNEFTNEEIFLITDSVNSVNQIARQFENGEITGDEALKKVEDVKANLRAKLGNKFTLEQEIRPKAGLSSFIENINLKKPGSFGYGLLGIMALAAIISIYLRIRKKKEWF